MTGLKDKIRDIPDFPKKGVTFRDITTLLKDGSALRQAVEEMEKCCSGKRVDAVVGIESRGFILGSIMAKDLGVGFVPVRKKGKLPWETVKADYELEYGVDAVEMHRDGVVEGQNVLVVDDLIATGGTARATAQLVEELGGRVAGFCFLIELSELGGTKKIKGYGVHSVIEY
jgi:adenine phosphoribosyltransferase